MDTIDSFISDLTQYIVPMPAVLQNIRLLMASHNNKISDFEHAIESSQPMLASSVIRFANSNFLGFERKAGNLNEAISAMGAGLLHDMLLGSFCLHAFNNHGPDHIFNFDDFWHQQIKQGIAAYAIAKYCHIPGNHRFFTIGLLLEIGHAAMLLKAPIPTLKALQESVRQNLPVDSIEATLFGFDYCQLGAELCHHWHLPVIYQQLIKHYLYPSRAKPAFRKETEITHLAHLFCSPSQAVSQPDLTLLNPHEQLVAKKLAAKEISQHLDDVYAMLNIFSGA